MLQLWDDGGEESWLQSFQLRSPLRPWYDEIDSYGHVSNVQFPRYFEFGRMQYFKTAGDPEPLDGAFPYAHVIAELHIRYIARVFYDEQLTILTKIAELGRSSAVFEQAVVGLDEHLRAVARTVVVHTNKHANAPWTARQRSAIAAFEKTNAVLAL